MQLEQLPLNANGKVDRKKLPLPQTIHQTGGSEYIAPRNEIETLLVEMWCEILETSQISIHDSFFQLGGDSFRIMKFHRRLSTLFPGKISIVDLFDYTTIEEIASFLNTQDQEEAVLQSFDV
jgi:aryl carrier-like protein